MVRIEILDKIKARIDKERVITVGIDGPTASGKTTLANALKEELVKEGINCWIYRLDWSLLDRAERVKDLQNLREKNVSFDFEAELHMRLSIVRDFLLKVARFNQKNISGKNIDPKIILENLYSREHDGKKRGNRQC